MKLIQIRDEEYNVLRAIKIKTHVPFWFIQKVLCESLEGDLSDKVDQAWEIESRIRAANWGFNHPDTYKSIRVKE